MRAAAVTAHQCLRGMAVGRPRARARASSSTPAPVRLTARKVQTETSLTARGNRAQFVPHTSVRTRTSGRALAAAVGGMAADDGTRAADAALVASVMLRRRHFPVLHHAVVGVHAFQPHAEAPQAGDV